MRDGDVVEKGAHAELLARGGYYAELYNSQLDEAAQGQRTPRVAQDEGPPNLDE